MVVCTYGPSYSGAWGGRITWAEEAEIAVSQDRTTALQPVLQTSKTMFHKEKKKNKWRISKYYNRQPSNNLPSFIDRGEIIFLFGMYSFEII